MKINTTTLALYAGAVKIGGSRGATINLNMETIDCTTKDSAGWKEILAGLRSGSFEIEGLIDFTHAFGSDELADLIINRTEITLMFTTNQTGDRFYSGNVYSTNWSGNSPGQEEVAGYSSSFDLNGPITPGNVA